jgi:two-component system LytT family response regulator
LQNQDESLKANKLALTTPRGVVLRPVEEIVSLNSSGNYCFVHFTDDSKVIVSRTMKEMEAQLGVYNFFRIHHSVLINCDKVKIYRHKEGYVEMIGGESFSVSFRRRSSFLKFIKQLEPK